MSKHTIILAFLLICTSFTYSQNTNSFEEIFSVAPYVLDVKPESATIAIHLKKPMAVKVKVWMENGVKEFTSNELKKSHFIAINGLQSGKSYLYQVVCSKANAATNEKDPRFQIRTSGKEGESFTFAVYGDPRPGDEGSSYYHKAIIDQAIMYEPQFCLVLGDMVDDGSNPLLWENFFRIESPIISKSAIYPVLGDNDVEKGKGIYAQYFPMFDKGYYNFSWNGIQFFALNTWDTKGKQPSSELDLNSNQIKWFIAEMQKEEIKKAPYRIVFMHDPAYISRGRASEMLLDQWVPLFQQYNVDVVFASWHLYERLQYKGVTYVISGGAGAEIIWMPANPAYPSQVDAQRHHFCRVDVNSNSLTIKAIADDGTVLDSYSISPKSQSAIIDGGKERLVKELSKRIEINENEGAPILPINIFSYDDCNFCKTVINSTLPSLAKKYKLDIQLSYFDLGKKGAYELFQNVGAEFGRQDSDVPTIFIGNKVLGGEQEISSQLENELLRFKENPDSYTQSAIVPFQHIVNTSSLKKETFKSLSLGTVILGGLLDSINSYTIVAIIFLLSYLFIAGALRRRTLFYYIVIIFITQFVIGMGFYTYAKVLLDNTTFLIIVSLVILILILVLGLLSTVDYLRYTGGILSKSIFQFPERVKESNSRSGGNFTRKETVLASVLFGLGVVVAIIGLKSVGQEYFPILTLIDDPINRLQAVLYLAFYTLAFIGPLILIYLIALFGVSSVRIKTVFTKNMASIKLGFAIMFGITTLMVIYNIYGYFK
ncbi:MAG: metallophosphoesterase [Bacteroidales bacterium]|nr:metallophosphoesterase [Bacteroidales bacterium]